MHEPPLITVGLTTYDRLEMLRDAIDSIIKQDYQSFKVLIGNDCQDTPVSFEILGIEPDARIEIINHKENLGELNNQNFLLSISDSEWFIWLADDDVLHPEFLSKMIGLVSDDTSMPVAAAFTNYATGASIPESFYAPARLTEASYYSTSEFVKSYVSKQIHLIGCYGLMRTKLLKAISGIPRLGEPFSFYSDTLLPILLAEHGAIIWLDYPLIFLRTHAASNSMHTSELEAYTSAEVKFVKYLEELCLGNQQELNSGNCILPMLRWFANNEFKVLLRDESLSSIGVVLKFLNHQICVNFPLLEKKNWFDFFMFIVQKVLRFIFSKIKNKLVGSR